MLITLAKITKFSSVTSYWGVDELHEVFLRSGMFFSLDIVTIESDLKALRKHQQTKGEWSGQVAMVSKNIKKNNNNNETQFLLGIYEYPYAVTNI